METGAKTAASEGEIARLNRRIDELTVELTDTAARLRNHLDRIIGMAPPNDKRSPEEVYEATVHGAHLRIEGAARAGQAIEEQIDRLNEL